MYMHYNNILLSKLFFNKFIKLLLVASTFLGGIALKDDSPHLSDRADKII